MNYREEKDALGKRKVPADAYYGIQTIRAMEILLNGCYIFNQKCLRGITANAEHCAQMVRESPGLVTALVPYVGYDHAAELAARALAEKRSIYEL